MRIKIIRIFIISLFAFVVLGLFYTQAFRGHYYYNLSTNNRIRIVPLEGRRGRILDRNGKVLADNRISYDVMVTPQDIQSQQKLFAFLSLVLEEDLNQINHTYQRRKFMPFAPVLIAEDISRQQAMILEENKYRFPSLYVQESSRRLYPLHKNSAHVLGHIGKINRSKIERFKEYGYTPQSIIGYLGVEEYYDSFLRGEEGGLQIEVDSSGQQVRLLSLREPTKGQDITLTLDSRIQQMMVDLLHNKVGTMIIMDMENGEILGMTSSPAFDPNYFVERDKIKRVEALFSDPKAPFVNRAIKGKFPPGSVFKVSVAICGLDSKKITQHTPFHCPGYYEIGGTRFRCSHAHGTQTLIGAIARSCNVYFYHLGRTLGADAMHRTAHQLGLGQVTNVDLPFEKVGFIPSRRQGILTAKRRWFTGDTLNFSIGQGDMLITPIQLVLMMATIANEGKEVQPHVIKAIGDQSLDKYKFHRQVNIDQKVFQQVKKGLRATVADYSGTAHVLDMKELFIAGKTGTAQVKGKTPHAWFVGYVNGNNKNIAFCIFLEHGGSSRNACLLARQLLLKMHQERIL